MDHRKCWSTKNEFFMTLTKLRLDFIFADLSQYFGIDLKVFALKFFIHGHGCKRWRKVTDVVKLKWRSKTWIMSYEFKSTSYLFKSTSYEFKFRSYDFKSTSYKFKFTSYSGLSLIRTLRGNLNLFELWRVRIRGSRSFLKYSGNRNRYYRPE